jgi:REP element-mobilizing transposase RayT
MQIDYWQPFKEEGYYHIYNRSNGKELIFKYAEDANEFLKRFSELVAPYCDVLAYCLMSNHFHFVLYCKPIDEVLKERVAKENSNMAKMFLENQATYNDFLVAQFARLFLGFSKYYNLKFKRNGNLFQKKFKRIQQKTLTKVVSRICYVHHNPLHHDAASFYDGYQFSSFNAYLNEKPTKIAKDLTFSIFKELPTELLEINTNALFETGIYDFPDALDNTQQKFLFMHTQFHKEWLEKKSWEDFDDLDV